MAKPGFKPRQSALRVCALKAKPIINESQKTHSNLVKISIIHHRRGLIFLIHKVLLQINSTETGAVATPTIQKRK